MMGSHEKWVLSFTRTKQKVDIGTNSVDIPTPAPDPGPPTFPHRSEVHFSEQSKPDSPGCGCPLWEDVAGTSTTYLVCLFTSESQSVSGRRLSYPMA